MRAWSSGIVPALRGKTIVVITPSPSDSTCAIAASYEAKRFGIVTGTEIDEARRLCPALICAPARHDIYVEYRHKILAEVIKHTPINKIWSIDELFSKLPPNKRTKEASGSLAARIKAGMSEPKLRFIASWIWLSFTSSFIYR